MHSQGFTFKWSGGYAWQPGGTISAPLINTQTPALDQLVPMVYSGDTTGGKPKVVHNSYGQGFNIGVRLGYQINPYIGIDIGVSYASSATISCNQLHTLYLPDSTGIVKPTNGYVNANLATQSQSVTLSPAVTLSYAKPKFKFYPYLRIGLSLPVWTQIQHTTSMNLIGFSADSVTRSSPYFIGNQTNDTIKTTTKFSVGVTGAIGVVYRVHSFLQLFAEVNAQFLNLNAKAANYTGLSADGVSILSSRGNRNTINAVPTLPFSYIGFNIGVQLFLNNKIFTDRDKFEETRKHKAKAKPKPAESESPKQK